MLSAKVFTANVILMSGRFEINSKISEHMRLARCRHLLTFALVLIGFAGSSCSPVLREAGGETSNPTLNPIEILEKSPRMYHIAFRSIADSIETALSSSYLAGSLDAASFPRPRVLAALKDSSRTEDLMAREIAELEYVKASRRFDAGAEQAASYHLKRAMTADPSFRPPYIMLGDMLLERDAIERAFDLFSRVLTWDSTDSNALVGLATCAIKMGRIADARKALVDAVIFDRVNLKAWSLLSLVVGTQGCSTANHDVPELGLVRKLRGRHYKIVIDASLEDCPVEATAWIAYASERAVWKYEDKYKTYFGVTKYAPTYEEDVDCYMVLAAAWKTLAQRDSAACDPEYLEYLSKVAEDGYLVSHVLFDRVCIKAPTAARQFSVEVIGKMREYVNTYVIVPKG